MASLQARRAALQRRMRAANARVCRDTRQTNNAIREWMEAAHEDALLALLAQIMDCYGRLVQRTPVDTGRARAGWHIEGQTDEWTPDAEAYEEAKGKAAGIIARETAKLGGLAGADVVYIMNNVEYILPLEAGWSRQSSGFIALFLTELRMQLESAAEAWRRAQ